MKQNSNPKMVKIQKPWLGNMRKNEAQTILGDFVVVFSSS